MQGAGQSPSCAESGACVPAPLRVGHLQMLRASKVIRERDCVQTACEIHLHIYPACGENARKFGPKKPSCLSNFSKKEFDLESWSDGFFGNESLDSMQILLYKIK